MVKKRVKVCQFCKSAVDEIDYKDIGRIRRFTSSRGKILSTKVTGTCAKHQRMLAKSLKRARFLAMLPYIKT
ncbi:30S ribosomal protein S18 [bacterium]|nr:30S ribosomal protein S18 [bacterium]